MRDKRIRLYPTQFDFLQADKFSGFIAGIGSGKTFVGALKALLWCKQPTLGMIVAPTFGMLRDSTLRTFLDLAENEVEKMNKGEMIAHMRSGAEVMFRSADKPDRLRGPNLHWAWIDEGGLCRNETWEITIGRVRADKALGDVWITSTPKGKSHWTYKQADHMKMFRAATLDNPYVSDEWKESLLASYTGNFLRQEVYGEFVSFQGLVYNMFDVTKHVMECPFEPVGFELAVDEGYTNPAVILKIAESADGEYHVCDEWYERGKLHSQIVDKALSMGKYDAVIDSSAAGLRAAFRNAGFTVRASKGRVLDGVAQVQELLRVRKDKPPRLTIDPSCVHTINEFESYVWREDRDEPVKEFDHAMDALRYKVMTKPRGRKAVQYKW